MITTLSKRPKEKSSYTVTVSFTDGSGSVVVPSEITWSLYDKDENVVNGREDVSISADSEVDIELYGDDLVLGKKVLLIEATIDGMPVKDAVYIPSIVDLPGVD